MRKRAFIFWFKLGKYEVKKKNKKHNSVKFAAVQIISH